MISSWDPGICICQNFVPSWEICRNSQCYSAYAMGLPTRFCDKRGWL